MRVYTITRIHEYTKIHEYTNTRKYKNTRIHEYTSKTLVHMLYSMHVTYAIHCTTHVSLYVASDPPLFLLLTSRIRIECSLRAAQVTDLSSRAYPNFFYREPVKSHCNHFISGVVAIFSLKYLKHDRARLSLDWQNDVRIAKASEATRL